MPPVNELWNNPFLTTPTTPQNFADSVIGELEKPKEKEEIYLDEDFKKSKRKIDEGKTPLELDFFVGGNNTNFEKKSKVLNLNEQNLKFLKYLQSDICSALLANNKIKIHGETGDIFLITLTATKELIIFFLQSKMKQNF